MSDSKYFIRCKTEDVLADLERLPKSLKNRKICMKRIAANVTLGNSQMARLTPQVMDIYTDADLECQRLCCLFFSFYAQIYPQLYLERRGLFIAKLNDKSLDVRILTLKTIACFTLRSFHEEVTVPILERFFKNQSAVLRKTACYAVAQLYQISPEIAQRNALSRYLYTSIRDEDPEVVASALAALDFIAEETDETYELDENIVRLLLPALSGNPLPYILNALTRYVPQTEQSAIDVVQGVLSCLQHVLPSVVIDSIKVIVSMSNYIRAPQDTLPSLPKRLGSAIISLLAQPTEMQFLVLRNVILLLLAAPELMRVDVATFFCHHNDPIFIQDTKLEIMYLLAGKANLSVVLRELTQYATLDDVSMCRKSIRAMGNLAVKISEGATECVDVLVSLAESGIPHIVQETVIVMKNIYRKYPETVTSKTLDLFIQYSDEITEPEPKASFLWIVGSFPELVPRALDVLKDFAYSLESEPIEVQLTLLTAVVKHYLVDPSAKELTLDVLKRCSEMKDPDIRDRAMFYWKALSTQDEFPGAAKDIILAALPTITSEMEKLDPEVLQELELNIGTLVLIYLKPVLQVFRLSKPRRLVASPALQVDYNRSIQSPEAELVEEKVLRINVQLKLGTIRSSKMEYSRDNEVSIGKFGASVELLGLRENQKGLTVLKKKSKDLLKLAEEVEEKTPKLETLKRKITMRRKK